MKQWTLIPRDGFSASCPRCNKGRAWLNQVILVRQDNGWIILEKQIYCPACQRCAYKREQIDPQAWHRIKGFYKSHFRIEGMEEQDAAPSQKAEPPRPASGQLNAFGGDQPG